MNRLTKRKGAHHRDRRTLITLWGRFSIVTFLCLLGLKLAHSSDLYYLIDPQYTDDGAAIMSLEDNNQITSDNGAIDITLSRQEVATLDPSKFTGSDVLSRVLERLS